MMKVFGLPIIYAFIPVLIYIVEINEPAPGTLYPPIIVNLSGFVPKNLTPFCKWNPIKQFFENVIELSQPKTIP